MSLLEDFKKHKKLYRGSRERIHSVLDDRTVTISKSEAKSFLIYSFAQVIFGMFITTFFVVMAATYTGASVAAGLYGMAAFLSCLALAVFMFYKFISLIVLSIGRLRDTGLPVWLSGLVLLGLPGIAVLTILLFGESKNNSGSNAY